MLALLVGGCGPASHAPEEAEPAGLGPPTRSNVASFHDVDGVVDYEVWANLAAGG